MARLKKAAIATPASTNATINECLNISNYMYYGQYTAYSSTPLPGNINLQVLQVDGHPVQYTNASQGLFEEAFITPGSGANRQVIIGYEGTDLYDANNPNYYQFTGGQVVDDAAIAAGQVAPSFKPSAKFASKVLSIAQGMGIAKSNVLLTGHSLGAAEAEYAAAATGLSGYTFGTPGIVAPAHAKTSSLVNFVDYGDPVGNYANDGQQAYGPQTYKGIISNTSYPRIIISNSIKHYQSLNLVGSTSNYDDLSDAIEDYNDGSDFAAVDFDDALAYHHLSNYATDLQANYNGINLYPIGSTGDGSVGADANFLGLIRQETPSQAMCFVTGTGIRTTRGECAVEDLVVGDVAVTASGETRPIVWIGHRYTVCQTHHDLHPVRVAAHAFGADLPARELTLSPGHPVLVGADEDNEGGWLVPIMCLINGTTVRRVAVDTVTYWHVELDAHDILLAENLPAESYLDGGDRDFFQEGSDHALANPDFVVPGLAGRCRPVALQGPVVEAAQRRLDTLFATRLSIACAWPGADDFLIEGAY